MITVTLKLFSQLGEYLPPDADGTAVSVKVAPTTSAHDLIARYKVPPGEAKVMMVNGESLPVERRDDALKSGDVVAVWPAIQGG